MDGWWQRLLFERERLWRVIRLSAFAGTPFVTAGLFACGPCPEEDHIFLLRAPDAQVQQLVDLCQKPQRDCEPLCRHLVRGEFLVAESQVLAHCELHGDREGYLRVHVGWREHCPGGRRPEGLRLPNVQDDASEVGAWLGTLAALEAASVPAFERLAMELAAHDAPPSLVRAALAAARDEVIHARMGARLAERYGVRAQQPGVPAFEGVRRLDEILAENAVEGCVREAYGAVSAAHQASTAGDPFVRRAFRRIADDESRHAALGLAVDCWGRTKLSAKARQRLRQEKELAVDLLLAETAIVPSLACTATLGLPPPELSHRMVMMLREETCDRA
ncbi:MAG TPA: ferritin-like domain-containing protein [Polyangia bacterium]